jgi:predicted restriction endonuclease
MANVLATVIGTEFSAITSQPVNLLIDDTSFDSVEASLRMRMEISETEKLQLVKSRRGQGLFKANVRLVESACRVTGVNQISMLRASHVKPWSVSDDQEKIDGFNGLLLAPHVDHLFDKGYITFESKGELVLSPNLNIEILDRWSIPKVLNVGSFSAEQAVYLNYHQEKVFVAS